MTEQTREERIAAALSELGTQVRQRAARPAPGAIRGLAEHRQRVRRTAAAALAAAAVLALAIGGIGVVRGSAAPPPSDPASTVTPSPSPSPRASRSVSPWPEPKVGDPIGATDWENAAITLPAHGGCPSGVVTFQRHGEDVSGPSGWPRVVLNADSGALRTAETARASCWWWPGRATDCARWLGWGRAGRSSPISGSQVDASM